MSSRGKIWLLTCDEGAEGVWESEWYLYYLIQLDRFHLKLLHSETCLKMPVGPAWLDCTASGPRGRAEVPAGTGTWTQPRHNTSEELLWAALE